ncbi:hypothetical protein RHMOL_Rhmol03G0116600 [Rhododendron molle]|uniref:Uncharacterized protein n=1 Tax=Rhododendron molle TaxID=49168 RepID=A0ACC0PD79_RHOML|nr:hypothetical protein RHMOL_Rhmol03G0116600 [Rhododendron molle]
MDTWTLLLCIIILCYVANLAFVFWSIYKVHDEAKDKTFEFEMSWVCDESKRQREKVISHFAFFGQIRHISQGLRLSFIAKQNLHVTTVGSTAGDVEGFERSNISGQLLRHPSGSQNMCANQVAATCLIAICELIGPDLTTLHVLLKLNELFDELVFSQEIGIASGTLERSSKVTKPKSGEDEIESRMDLVFLLYPSFASLLGMEKLSQGCATWLLLEQSLLQCHNWKVCFFYLFPRLESLG